jgi:hypothetical protein
MRHDGSCAACGETEGVRRFMNARLCPAHFPPNYAPPPGCTFPLRCYCPKHVPPLSARAEYDPGIVRKGRGQENAISASDPRWLSDAKQAILTLAAFGRPFTSEDVTERVGLPRGVTGTNKNNAVGAIMSAAARRNIIRKTGRHVLSKRASSHGAELIEWIGAADETNTYQGEARRTATS